MSLLRNGPEEIKCPLGIYALLPADNKNITHGQVDRHWQCTDKQRRLLLHNFREVTMKMTLFPVRLLMPNLHVVNG